MLGLAACGDDSNDDDAIGTDDRAPATTPTTTESAAAPDTTPSTSVPDGADGLRLGSAGSWSPDAVATIELDDTNTAPLIDSALADGRVFADHWVWDWWYVRDRDGEPADFDGTLVAIGLTAPADELPGKRHDIAELRYLTSGDGGESWTEGGPLFEPGSALGSRQWAGSAMYDADTETLYAFYTAAGEVEPTDTDTSDTSDSTTTVTTSDTDDDDAITTDDTVDTSTTTGTDTATGIRATPTSTTPTSTTPTTGDDMSTTVPADVSTTTPTTPDAPATSAEADTGDDQAPSGGTVDDSISYRQGLALATATMVVNDDGVTFDDWSDHEMLVDGDDTELYSSTESTSGGAGSIDAFRDPWYFRADDGEEYLLFTATMPQAECDGDGVVGIAQATSSDLTDWELLPPLLDAHCVNNELERPHVIRDGGRLYVLFTTHGHTFSDGASGPEGYYGFVADSLDGPFEPLNGTGLVIANPAEAAYQAYSWMGHPNGVVTSFFQFFDLGDVDDLDYIGDQSPEFQLDHFGGTYAPSLRVEFDGDTTRIVEELAPGSYGR